MTTLESRIKSRIRDVPDFPKPGILFKDITPVVADAPLFREVIQALVERYRQLKPTALVGVESRGFILGTPMAYEMGLPFHLIRKQGKLPYQTVKTSYDLEYGSATVEMHVDALKPGDRVVLIDDLLATGGTAGAACKLIQQQGATVLECAFLVELGFLKGRDHLNGVPIHALCCY